MALVAVLAAALTAGGCSRGERFRPFEYEEEMFLALDGSATVYVNTSVAALDALRGASFPTTPSALIDREAVRTWFTTPVTRVIGTPSLSRRSGRRFVHVRVDVDDVAKLTQAGPFAWSTYRLTHEGEMYAYKQTVGDSAHKDVGDVGWDGQEGVSFRMHLPSTVVYHNAGPKNLKRGNVIVWEQALTDRLHGEPLVLDVRMESQTILSRTLLLFGATLAAVAAMFAVLLWWILRRGRKPAL